MPEDEVSPEIERLIGRLKIRGWKRPNWGWGSREPVPMFTETEIRAACAAAKLLDQQTDDIIDTLKVTRTHRRKTQTSETPEIITTRVRRRAHPKN
ncbi:MAG: hypothetical protein ACXVX6_05365 [Mycobacterium sp.]